MILDDILAETRRTVAEARASVPLATLEARAKATPPPRDFYGALRGRPLACIAEFKRKSPSAGWIRQGADPADIAVRYQKAGAAAMSVLTDGPFFGGRLEDMAVAKASCALPILRKDFIVDPYQVVEARAAGADAILLIVSALSDAALDTLSREATRWGLDVLCEAHDPAEAVRAVHLPARIIGINHRDLRTFTVDTTLAKRMRPSIPPDRLLVAESGIKTASDVHDLRAAGINAILVGESLMRGDDPGLALKALLREP